MDKTIEKTQYGYTYVVKYKYHDDNVEEIGYYCSDSDSVSLDEIKKQFEFEDEDEYEIVYQWSNDFNLDKILSDKVIFQLEGNGSLNDKEYAIYSIGYILILYNENIIGREQYKKEVLTAVLKYMDLRKQNLSTIYVVNGILGIFGIERNNNVNLRKQIELYLDPKANGEILYQLASSRYAKIVGHHLEKIGSVYKIHEEKSLYRIGVLFLRIFDALNGSGFLSSKFTYKDGRIGSYSKFMTLMSSYYGVANLNYREGVLRTYTEKGAKSSLYNIIRNEHLDVWLPFIK